MIGIGALANSGAIILGSCIGLLIHSRLPEKMVSIVFQAIGLFTVVIGISMGLASENMILVLLSLVIGGIIGQAIDLDKQLRRFSDFIKHKTERKSTTNSPDKEKKRRIHLRKAS